MNYFETGKKYYRELIVTEDIMSGFKNISGDNNPLHVDENYAKSRGFEGKVAYGNILGAMVSALVGMSLGTEEVMLVSQSLNFRKPVFIGDKINLCATVSNISEAAGIIELSMNFTVTRKNGKNEKAASGKCQVKCL